MHHKNENYSHQYLMKDEDVTVHISFGDLMSSIFRIIFTNCVASWIWDFLEWRVSMTDNCFMSPHLVS